LSIKAGSLAVPYNTVWDASAGYVEFPSISDIAWDGSNERDRKIQAKKTARHARENKNMGRSECSWEFDAWRDVFSEIRDDPLLAM
jgi:hypothetical protein